MIAAFKEAAAADGLPAESARIYRAAATRLHELSVERDVLTGRIARGAYELGKSLWYGGPRIVRILSGQDATSETLAQMAKRHEEELQAALDLQQPPGKRLKVSIVHMIVDDPPRDVVSIGTTVPPAALASIFKYLALKYAPRNTEDRKKRH